MKISTSQFQLLRQLNIRPLQTRSGFFPEPVLGAPSLTVNTAELLQPVSSGLTEDIKLLLSQSTVNNWLLDPGASQCMLINNNSLLITPELTKLQQPAMKQQLWVLLQQQLVNDAD